MKTSAIQQLRELVEQLRLLIDCANELPPSPERDEALSNLARYRDRLHAIMLRTLN